ncbi:hypothetical protein [Trichothermofontia sp.]
MMRFTLPERRLPLGQWGQAIASQFWSRFWARLGTIAVLVLALVWFSSGL